MSKEITLHEFQKEKEKRAKHRTREEMKRVMNMYEDANTMKYTSQFIIKMALLQRENFKNDNVCFY